MNLKSSAFPQGRWTFIAFPHNHTNQLIHLSTQEQHTYYILAISFNITQISFI